MNWPPAVHAASPPWISPLSSVNLRACWAFLQTQNNYNKNGLQVEPTNTLLIHRIQHWSNKTPSFDNKLPNKFTDFHDRRRTLHNGLTDCVLDPDLENRPNHPETPFLCCSTRMVGSATSGTSLQSSQTNQLFLDDPHLPNRCTCTHAMTVGDPTHV